MLRPYSRLLEDTTVGDALRLHYALSGLPRDGGASAPRWRLKLGSIALGLANFEWRRRALKRHDIHHVLTGYACTPTGEFEMAAWEFAAGRFPNLWATLFCLPLVGFGALTIPCRSLAAFVRGRRSATLYLLPAKAALLDLPIVELQRRVLPAVQPMATWRDIFEYTALAGLSLLLTAAPFLLLAVLLT